MLKNLLAQAPLKSILWSSSLKSWIHQGILVVLGSLFLTVASKAQIPFEPVPLTLQTLAVFFIAMTYGTRLALMTMGAFYLQILAGFPVTAGPTVGVGVFMGPTGGFVIGWAFAMLVSGYLVEKGWGRSIIGVFTAQVLGSIA